MRTCLRFESLPRHVAHPPWHTSAQARAHTRKPVQVPSIPIPRTHGGHVLSRTRPATQVKDKPELANALNDGRLLRTPVGIVVEVHECREHGGKLLRMLGEPSALEDARERRPDTA